MDILLLIVAIIALLLALTLHGSQLTNCLLIANNLTLLAIYIVLKGGNHDNPR